MSAYDRTQAARRAAEDAEFRARLHRLTAPAELGYEAAWLTQPGQLSQAEPDGHVPTWPWSARRLLRAASIVMLLASLALVLSACGGGAADEDEVAAHDAEATKTIQPVTCAASCCCTK